MRQAADILASPAAMQIRQLEALQAMAKTASSKVIFVPMQLQSDVVGSGASAQGTSSQAVLAPIGEAPTGARGAGILASMADI